MTIQRVQEWAAEQWFNGPQGGTPITAERLDRVEEQIEALTIALNAVPEVVQGEDGADGADGVDGVDGDPGITLVHHGVVADTARPDVPLVYWIGTSTPANAVAWDFWLEENV